MYALPCQECDKLFIGQTSRGIIRCREHISDGRREVTNSAPFLHKQLTQHNPDFPRFTQLYHEEKYFNCLHTQTFLILLHIELVYNVQIPTHYGISNWIKFVKAHLPKFVEHSKKCLEKKIHT